MEQKKSEGVCIDGPSPSPASIHFASTETEQEHGHMEGAVVSGLRVARELSTYFEQDK